MKSLLSLYRSLLTDIRRLQPDVRGLDRDLVTIEARLENEGDSFVSVALPAFCQAIDYGLASGRLPNVPHFSKVKNGRIPKFLQGIVSQIFDSATGILRNSPSIECILSARQVLNFAKKYLPGENRGNVLHDSAIKSFLDTDEELSRLCEFDSVSIRTITSFMLPNLDVFDFLEGRHGPGAVVEGLSTNQKWKVLLEAIDNFDSRLSTLGTDLFAENPYLRSPSVADPALPSAKLVTVPKTCTALRTITVEPCVSQFVQQAYGEHLRHNIRKCSILSQCLTLTDQSKNQILALEGSQTGDWCTIDLSSASDRLDLRLVDLVFANRPRFLRGIRGCRTPSVNVNGVDVTLKKYAGMGNATTFPVQSVVFATLCIDAILSHLSRIPRFGDVLRAARCIRVYGDDIIVKREYFQAVVDRIQSFGLKVNQKKTFSDGLFRESCGVDAYDGTDVTPCYLRHDPGVTTKDARSLASFVETSNQLWFRGLYATSNNLRRIVEGRLGRLPLLSQRSSGLGWRSRQDVSTISRWNSRLHRFEVRTYVVRSNTKPDTLDDRAALLKCLLAPKVSEFDRNHLESSSAKFNVKLSRRWVQS